MIFFRKKSVYLKANKLLNQVTIVTYSKLFQELKRAKVEKNNNLLLSRGKVQRQISFLRRLREVEILQNFIEIPGWVFMLIRNINIYTRNFANICIGNLQKKKKKNPKM